MAVSLTHTTVAVGTDAGNGEIARAEWNEEHTLTMGTGKLLGRTTAGSGAVEEITPSEPLRLSGGAISYPRWPTFSGNYFMTPSNTNSSSQSLGADILTWSPIFVGHSFTANRIGINVVSGAAGAARLGVYAPRSDSDPDPGLLILDAGTIDTSTTGVKEITISQAFTPGLYLLALVGNATVSYQSAGATGGSVIWGSTRFQTHISWSRSRSFTYAALPSDESAQTYTQSSNQMLSLFVRTN